MTKIIRVVQLQRHPGPGKISIERVFAEVRESLPLEVSAKPRFAPYESSNVRNLLRNMAWARRNAGEITHILGDVHYLAFSSPRLTTMLTIHDCGLIERNRGLRRLFFLLFWYRLPIRRAKTVTTVSEYTKNRLINLVDCAPSRIHVIHNPVSRTFRQSKKEFLAGEPSLLQIGTGWNKNLENVIEAIRGLRCRLDIVGALSKHQYELLNKHQIKYRQYYGVTDQTLLDLYDRCDILTFTSTYEGFGLPIIEAQACGKPVVASNVCSMPEVAGKGACLVSPYDARGIREAVERIINNRVYREEVIESGIANIKRFERLEIARRYCDLYSQLA